MFKAACVSPSVQRSVYKDLVLLLQKEKYLTLRQLKSKASDVRRALPHLHPDIKTVKRGKKFHIHDVNVFVYCHYYKL